MDTPRPSLAYVIRDMLPSDSGFVAKSWVGEARRGTRQTRRVDSALFTRWHHRAVEKALSRPGVRVRVAGPPGDDATVYGYVVLEGDCVHCVYVRSPLRRLGIARALLQGVRLEEAAFSCWSQDLSNWILTRYPGLRYAPLWLTQHEEATDGRSNREAAAAA